MLNIDKSEKWFVVVVIFLILLATSSPQVIGWFLKKDKYFLSIPICNSADTVSHLSWIKQGEKCNILFKNKYTTEEQKRVVFHPLFLSWGKLARIFNFSPPQIFILSRIFSAMFLLVVIYLLISFITNDKFIRKVSFALISFSSGLGSWLVVLKIFYPAEDIVNPNYPLDLWCPEAITFLGIYISPLIIFSLSLIIIIFLLYLLALKNKNYIFLLSAGILNSLLGLIHPYDIFITTSVIAFYSIYLVLFEKNKNTLLYTLIFIILTLPVIYYHYFCLTVNPMFKLWLSSPRLSPTLLSIILGYGFLIPFAAISIIRKKTSQGFLLIWIITICIIIFLPISFQRRLIEGLHIPLCLISAPAIISLSKRYFTDYKKAIRLFIILVSFTNISILISDIKEYKKVEFPYYIEKEIIEGFDFLDKNTKESDIILPLFAVDDLILTSYPIGNLIPAYSGNFTYLGHYDLTVNIENKINHIQDFISSKIDKYKFLKDNKIKYIFLYSKGEVFINYNFLRIIYRNDKVKIYEFIPG